VLFKEHVRLAVESFGELRHGDRTDEAAEKNAREIDDTLVARSGHASEFGKEGDYEI
jgi:hypothetical protein